MNGTEDSYDNISYPPFHIKTTIYLDNYVQNNHRTFKENSPHLWLFGIYIFLLYKLVIIHDFKGFSYKTQILYMIIFLTRHLDVWFDGEYSFKLLITLLLIASSTAIVSSVPLYQNVKALARLNITDSFEDPMIYDTFSVETLATIVLMVFFGISLRRGFPDNLTDCILILKPIGIILETMALLPQIIYFKNSRHNSNYATMYMIMLVFYYAYYVTIDLPHICEDYASLTEFLDYFKKQTPTRLNRIPGFNSVVPVYCCSYYIAKAVQRRIGSVQPVPQQVQRLFYRRGENQEIVTIF